MYFLHECRSYYRCTQDHCRVKKRVERLAEDPRMVITTYEGRHVHSPSHDSEDSEAQTHLNNFFWYPLSLSLSHSKNFSLKIITHKIRHALYYLIYICVCVF